MYEELSENAQKLYDLLFTLDFDAGELTRRLKAGEFSCEDINRATLRYVDDCIHPGEHHEDWDHDSIDEKYAFGEDISGLESSHLLEAMRILLDFGLDPNYSTDGDITGNIMWGMHFVFNGYQAADAVALMLEHGGDPNLELNGWRLIDDLCVDISWFLGGDEDSRYIADSFMKYWMVFVGYGAKWEDGSEIVKTYANFQIEDFRDHRNYYCGFIHVKYDDDPVNTSAVSFFDKRTNREVARLE